MTGDMTTLLDLDGNLLVMTNVHDKTDCEGRETGCWVHAPTGWPLAMAPIHWDETTRRAYRRCEHGQLHRDLDDYTYFSRHSTRYVGMPPWCCPDGPACACCPAHFRG